MEQPVGSVVKWRRKKMRKHKKRKLLKRERHKRKLAVVSLSPFLVPIQSPVFRSVAVDSALSCAIPQRKRRSAHARESPRSLRLCVERVVALRAKVI
jgi:hypothetical protein